MTIPVISVFDSKDVMTKYNYDNMRFLIVDNIKPSQEILKQFVMGLTTKKVDSTHYAQDVASICQQRSYDVIFLGYDLGDNQKNGQQILEELRVNGYINRHCIVILITAEMSQAMVLAALEHKPDHYLCKPYTLSELEKRLNSCLHKKMAMTSIYQALDDNDPQLVINHCKHALSIDTPYKTECLGILARQYFELDKFDLAKRIYLAHQHTANCQWATIGLGKLALHEKKLSQAEKLFKLLIKDYPLYLSSYDWLAVTYEEQFHHILAEEILEQALLLSPRSLTRLKKYAHLCFHNERFDKATTAYERNYNLAQNSIHHCADNTIKYVQALIEYAPSLPLVDAKKINNKAFSFLKQMARDFKDSDIKVQSHFLAACLFAITKERQLANDEIKRGERILTIEHGNIESSKLNDISLTLKKLNRNDLATKILITRESSEQTQVTGNIEIQHFTMKDRAQADIEEGLALYTQKKYHQATLKLQDASTMFPKHIGIKLNLTQILLAAYDQDNQTVKGLNKAKALLLELTRLDLNNNELERLKKMQKKYQLIAGI
jgi:DNA-binding response OmpR family regulator